MKKIFVLFIKGYQKLISPLKPPCCRFYPTCSAYAVQAIQKFGVFRGLWLATNRLLRCNPWNIGGIDYVPDNFHFFRCKNKQ